jgi:hypothetical protein
MDLKVAGADDEDGNEIMICLSAVLVDQMA